MRNKPVIDGVNNRTMTFEVDYEDLIGNHSNVYVSIDANNILTIKSNTDGMESTAQLKAICWCYKGPDCWWHTEYNIWISNAFASLVDHWLNNETIKEFLNNNQKQIEANEKRLEIEREP